MPLRSDSSLPRPREARSCARSSLSTDLQVIPSVADVDCSDLRRDRATNRCWTTSCSVLARGLEDQARKSHCLDRQTGRRLPSRQSRHPFHRRRSPKGHRHVVAYPRGSQRVVPLLALGRRKRRAASALRAFSRLLCYRKTQCEERASEIWGELYSGPFSRRALISRWIQADTFLARGMDLPDVLSLYIKASILDPANFLARQNSASIRLRLANDDDQSFQFVFPPFTFPPAHRTSES